MGRHGGPERGVEASRGEESVLTKGHPGVGCQSPCKVSPLIYIGGRESTRWVKTAFWLEGQPPSSKMLEQMWGEGA